MVKKQEKAKKQESKQEEVKVAAPAVSAGPKWVKVNAEQLAQLQEEKRLMGYRPETQEALIV